jgi:hypothetical protein
MVQDQSCPLAVCCAYGKKLINSPFFPIFIERKRIMISGIGNIGATFPSFGYAISVASRGRMSLPVAPSSYIYSQFEHVSGIPAPEGSRGVTISRLKVLNTLIEQLQQIKKNPLAALQLSEEKPSDERIDALIEQYENQIRQAQAAHAAMPYKPAPTAPAGAVFSLAV